MSTTDLELRIPNRLKESCVILVLTSGLAATAVAGAATGAAILLGWLPSSLVSKIAAVAWIALCGWALSDIVPRLLEPGATRRLATTYLGELSPWHCVWIDRDDTALTHFCVGYRLFGRRICTRRIPLARIVEVVWGPGQASWRVGRDVDDWTVWVRYETDAGRRCGDVVFLGPSSASRRTVEPLGHAIVDLLRVSGESLIAVSTRDLPGVAWRPHTSAVTDRYAFDPDPGNIVP